MIKIDFTNRKTREDKKTRVNPSLDKDTHNKLKKLSISCDMTKTMLASEIIKFAVNNVEIVNFLQAKYNQDDNYRVIPIRNEGKTFY